jgi:hypothetical protein
MLINLSRPFYLSSDQALIEDDSPCGKFFSAIDRKIDLEGYNELVKQVFNIIKSL